jgi:amidase
LLTNEHQDDPEVYHGAPVGLQVVARKHEEEKVWVLAKIVDTALKTAGYKVTKYGHN